MKNNNKLYMFTDENLDGMDRKLELKDKKVLTATFSGDQALNFLLEGAEEVKLFDQNVYAESYFYLKKALIENLSYQEFLNFFFPGFLNGKNFFSVEKYELVKDSLPTGKIRSYWDYIFNNYSKKEIKDLFVRRNYNKKDIINRNGYLKNEDNYNKLKEILKKIDKVEFKEIDILHELMYVQDKVDFMYLSTIMSHIAASDKVDLLKKIKALTLNLSYNLTDNGVVAVSYMHCYLDDYWHNLKANIQSIISTPFDKNVFIKDDCETIDFKGAYVPNSPVIKDRDAVLLYKNNKVKRRTKK